MSYIRDIEHFKNYLSKVAKINKVDPGDVCPFEFYLEHIYNAGLADQYTWKLKNEGAEFLRRTGVHEFLRTAQSADFYWPPEWELICSEAFSKLAESAYKQPGIYIFETAGGDSLYVGRSIDLGSRIVSSFRERLKGFNEQVYLKLILCGSKSDAAVLEVYFIVTLKPLFNTTCNYTDKLALSVGGIPPFTKRVPCFREEDNESKQDRNTKNLLPE